MANNTKERKRRRLLLLILCAAGVGCLTILIKNEGPGDRIELEGLYLDHNFRDLGKSMNSCMQSSELRFREERLFRANKWFSGWDCKNVGNPEKIVTLNKNEKNWQFFCRNDSGKRIVGESITMKEELRDIEFISTWTDKNKVEDICAHFKLIMKALGDNKRTLFHCEAGRDRTGAIAGLIAAIGIESKGYELDAAHLSAIECDYQRSASLKEHKYGRLANFLRDTQRHKRSTTEFIADHCGIDKKLLKKFGQHLML